MDNVPSGGCRSRHLPPFNNQLYTFGWLMPIGLASRKTDFIVQQKIAVIDPVYCHLSLSRP